MLSLFVDGKSVKGVLKRICGNEAVVLDDQILAFTKMVNGTVMQAWTDYITRAYISFIIRTLDL